MKLLSKQEVSKQKALESKIEIDEGLKLAKKIDYLREQAPKEEINLKKFRDETLKQIKSEIDSLISEKNSLGVEISLKRKEKLNLEAPLNLKELETEKKELKLLKDQLLEKETALISREIIVQGFYERELKIIEKEKEVQTYLAEAQKSYQKIEDLKFDIERKKKESETEIGTRYSELTKKEQELVSREFMVNKEKAGFSEERKKLLDDGASLIEKEAKYKTESDELVRLSQSLTERDSLTIRYHDEAKKNHESSERIKENAVKFKEGYEIEINNRLNKISDREKDLNYRERDLINLKETLEIREEEITKERLHIESQQRTLKTAWENIKKLKK